MGNDVPKLEARFPAVASIGEGYNHAVNSSLALKLAADQGRSKRLVVGLPPQKSPGDHQ